MTRLQLHILNWKDCDLCPYSQTRKRIVLGKGKIPCDLLFVGEAPGESEDVSGDPFDGQAGRLLDTIIKQAEASHLRIAFNNIVACFPLNRDANEKEEPDHECIMHCKPRLEEYIRIAAPRLIVAVGKQSGEYLDQSWRDAARVPQDTPITHIQHPASILRAPYVGRSLMVQKCVVTIRNAIRDHLQ